jgi:hypothetical protein
MVLKAGYVPTVCALEKTTNSSKAKMKIDQWQIGKLEQKFRRGFRNYIESYLKEDASTNFISFSF